MTDYKDIIDGWDTPEYLAYEQKKKQLDAIRSSITDEELLAWDASRKAKPDVPAKLGDTVPAHNKTSNRDFINSLAEAYYSISTATFDDDHLDYDSLIESAEIISAALAAYKESKNVVNRGFSYERTKHNPREAAFAAHWEKACVQSPGYNYGYGILQDLMLKGTNEISGRIVKVNRHITPMDAKIAATVVQWFGTNCGMAFLVEVLDSCGLAIRETRRDLR